MLTSLHLRRASVPLVKAWMVTVACRIMRNNCLTITMRYVFWITKATEKNCKKGGFIVHDIRHMGT